MSKNIYQRNQFPITTINQGSSLVTGGAGGGGRGGGG